MNNTSLVRHLSPEKRSLLEQRLKESAHEFDCFPLSFAQERLWFLDQWQPNSPVYNVVASFRLRGELDVEALEESLNDILKRHEILRTVFSAVEGKPVQVVVPIMPLSFTLVDLSALSKTDRDDEAFKLTREEAQRPFNLSHGPLLRTSVIRLDEQEHLLLMTMHHIVSDGWSMGILVRELRTLYEAYSTGRRCMLPSLPIQYADFAAWQREWLQGEVLEQLLAYWKHQLAGAPGMLELPADRPRPKVQTFRGAIQSFVLPLTLSAALNDLSRREGVTLFMTLLASFQTLLHRYTRQTDIVVGSLIANRNHADIEVDRILCKHTHAAHRFVRQSQFPRTIESSAEYGFGGLRKPGSTL
jgi:hypothetical protein